MSVEISIGLAAGGGLGGPSTNGGTGGFVPTDITSLSLWLDASDAATITHSSGSVSQWNDKSSQARHFSQATSGNQPTTGVNTINSKNVITFDGNDDGLVSSSTDFDLGSSYQRTYFLVANTKSGGAFSVGRILGYGSGYSTFIYSSTGSGGSSDGEMSYFNTVNTLAQYNSYPEQHLHIIVDDTGNVDYYADTATSAASSFTHTDNVTDTDLVLGNVPNLDRGYDGDIAEFLIYDAVLSSTDRQSVQTYLASKWGI